MKKLSELEFEKMEILNSYLLKAVKIDFMARIEKCALSDACTELEIKEFLRKEYPGSENPDSLSQDDREFLSLLMRYYRQKNKEHDKLKKEDAIKLAVPEPKPSLDFYDAIPSGCFKTLFELAY